MILLHLMSTLSKGENFATPHHTLHTHWEFYVLLFAKQLFFLVQMFIIYVVALVLSMFSSRGRLWNHVMKNWFGTICVIWNLYCKVEILVWVVLRGLIVSQVMDLGSYSVWLFNHVQVLLEVERGWWQTETKFGMNWSFGTKFRRGSEVPVV